MALLIWAMVGLAIWHFTVFLPDKFFGGIVGAFCAALIGSITFPLIIHLGSIPGQDDTNLLTGLEAIPGTVIAMGLAWWYGERKIERGEAPAPIPGYP